MIIGIDFDGTCVKHAYPNIGDDIGAVPVLKEFIRQGHKLILISMRSGELLDNAVQWLKERGIELYGVNHNPDQDSWTESPKIYAQLYIDDAGLGCPTNFDQRTGRTYVDWKVIAQAFGYKYDELPK
jgi:hypothetical protein